MSLIDEALRRARQEAARQDAARRDEQYRHVPVLPPSASRQRSSLRPALIGGAVVLCIVTGVGIGVMLGRDGGEPAPVAAPAPAAVPVLPAPQPPAAVVEEKPEPTPELSTPALTPSPEPPVREVPVAEAEPVNPPPSIDPSPPPPAPETTPVEPAPAAPAADIRTYVREVSLPDGGTLRLNGIAFSSSLPVALINDRVLSKGETYQGFTVTDIQANVVELQGNGMTVRVSLK